jgi:hypothetical protein
VTRRTLIAVVVAAAALPFPGSTASAAPVARFGSGPNAAAIQPTVDQFRSDLGGSNNGVGGTFATGRREINWDGVPDNFAEPNQLPFDFFNVNSPRGAIFQSVANISQHQFRVSADASNPTSTPVRFGNIEPSYSIGFQTFSPERLFAPRFANVVDVYFFLPGTNIPATVSGFGAVFADPDSSVSYIEHYAADGTKLSGGTTGVANNGLVFIGTSFNAGERVARVEIGLGNKPLGSGNVDGTAGVDVVTLDDFIYGEPQADPSTFRFADAQVTGAEGGNATVSVVRSGDGPASVDLATSDGTAAAGADYTPFSGTLSFAPGETVKTVTLPLASDSAAEGDETAGLTLSNPAGGSLGSPASATLSIVDRPPVSTPAPVTPILPPDLTAPAVVIGKVPKKLTRAKFLKGLKVAVTPSEAASLDVSLLGTTSRAVLARAGDVTLASQSLPLKAGARTIKLKPKRKLLAGAKRRFTARLQVVATDAAGNRTPVTRRVVVTPK